MLGIAYERYSQSEKREMFALFRGQRVDFKNYKWVSKDRFTGKMFNVIIETQLEFGCRFSLVHSIEACYIDILKVAFNDNIAFLELTPPPEGGCRDVRVL